MPVAAVEKETNMLVTVRKKKKKIVSWKKSRGTCLSPPVFPKVWRRPFWMTLESPSRVSSYEEREEGGKQESKERWGGSYIERKWGRRFTTDPWWRSPMWHAVMLVLRVRLCTPCVSVSLIVTIIRRSPLSLFTPPPPHDSPCLVCACWPSSGRWARL